jgi:GMP synthase-like glutamine amidotransferase
MILILQHHDCEGPAYIAELLEQRGMPSHILRPDQEPLPAGLKGYEALIILGGPQSVNRLDMFPWLRAEIEFIRRALVANAPVLGICLGSQLIASACGLRVLPGSTKEIGWFPVQRNMETDNAFFRVLPQEFECFHWHGEQVIPDFDLAPLASTDITPCQAFSPLPGVLALQFHLEMTADAIDSMATAFSSELEEAGISSDSLTENIDRRLTSSQRLADSVIGRWLDEFASNTDTLREIP